MTVNDKMNNSNGKLFEDIDEALSTGLIKPNILWVGCGDLFGKASEALDRVIVDHGATISTIDILERDKLRHAPPEGYEYYNVRHNAERSRLRKAVSKHPFTHIYIANWPEMHILSALKYSEACDQGTIIIAKPLDTNFDLIGTIARDVFPEFTEKIFVHDHYRNKGGIQPMYDVFPQLLNVYGPVTQFRAFLVEPRLIEDEGRLDPLECGVIFDLATHLFSLIQLFFFPATAPGVQHPIAGKKGGYLRNLSVNLEINHVVRGRYRKCALANRYAETFAAIDVALRVPYEDRVGRERERSIEGLLVVAKGVKAEHEVAEDVEIKGLELVFEGKTASLNFRQNSLKPDWEYFLKESTDENGYNASIIESLSKPRSSLNHQDKQHAVIRPMMTFKEACANTWYLRNAITASDPRDLIYHSPGATLSEVLNQSCSEGALDRRWRPQGGFTHLL